MEIILLGEKFIPSYGSRRIASIAIRFDNYNEACLFDCGESTQHYLLRSCLKNRQIKRILISELNSEACLGIIGLLATLSLNERLNPLELYGPQNFCKYIRLFSRYSQTNFAYPINIIQVKPGIISEFYNYRIIALPLVSNPMIIGYSIIEREKLGKFRIHKAQQFKIPLGPIYGALKRRKKFILSNSFIINGQSFCEPPKKGRKFTYITRFSDTRYLVELAHKADLLLINNSKINLSKKPINYYLINEVLDLINIKYFIAFDVNISNSKYHVMAYNPIQKQWGHKYLYLQSLDTFKILSNYQLDRIRTLNTKKIYKGI
uniref:hypothetical protein n=1 Tax=Stylonema alsidii TaxID=35155 RepID=UPI001FCD1BBF|nr:hypothetical protein MW559_pgp149 [Stylonema alsidii]UNJ15143.1 hypothetical protein [Stylonema alsidii]